MTVAKLAVTDTFGSGLLDREVVFLDFGYSVGHGQFDTLKVRYWEGRGSLETDLVPPFFMRTFPPHHYAGRGSE